MLHSIINELSGFEFEEFCKTLLESMGFDVEITHKTGDGGIDLIAYNFQPFLSGRYIIQCKRYTGVVGESIIRDLYGVVTSERANKGILITTGHFSEKAISFANGKNIELIDGNQLFKLIDEHNLELPRQIPCSIISEEEKEIFFDEVPEEYIFLCNALKNEPENNLYRFKIIETLANKFNFFLLNDMQENFNHMCVGMALTCGNILRRYIEPLINEKSRILLKKNLEQYYCLILLLAKIELINCNFTNSILLFDKIVHGDEIANDNSDYFYNHGVKIDSLASICSIFNALHMHEVAKKYCKNNNLILADKRTEYSNVKTYMLDNLTKYQDRISPFLSHCNELDNLQFSDKIIGANLTSLNGENQLIKKEVSYNRYHFQIDGHLRIWETHPTKDKIIGTFFEYSEDKIQLEKTKIKALF